MTAICWSLIHIKMKKGFLISLIIIVATIHVGIMLFFAISLFSGADDDGGDDGREYPTNGIDIDKKKYPITGVDFSKHNGKIDFIKLKKHPIDFIYIKATEGETRVDIMFEENYTGAKQNKMPIGAYHFFRFNKSGKKQAERFLSTIKGKEFDLPLALDVEKWGNSKAKNTELIKKEISAFITEVENKVKRDVIIYTNENGYKQFVKGKFDDKEIWICSFNDPPNIKAKWTFWQHSHRGDYDFADEWVDINTFNGNRDEWNNYLKK